jgi:hypothetical protein
MGRAGGLGVGAVSGRVGDGSSAWLVGAAFCAGPAWSVEVGAVSAVGGVGFGSIVMVWPGLVGGFGGAVSAVGAVGFGGTVVVWPGLVGAFGGAVSAVGAG